MKSSGNGGGKAAGALSNPNPIQLAAFAAQAPVLRSNGLDFPSIDYLFSSVRIPNVLGVRDWNLYLRGIESMQDHSLSALVSTENRVGEQGTILGELSAGFGPDTGELRGAAKLAGTLAYRHAW